MTTILTILEPIHRVYLDAYQISKVPKSLNAQYQLFVDAAKYPPPEGWYDGKLPRNKENHPVVNVNWQDAMTYCEWLSQMSGKPHHTTHRITMGAGCAGG